FLVLARTNLLNAGELAPANFRSGGGVKENIIPIEFRDCFVAVVFDPDFVDKSVPWWFWWTSFNNLLGPYFAFNFGRFPYVAAATRPFQATRIDRPPPDILEAFECPRERIAFPVNTFLGPTVFDDRHWWLGCKRGRLRRHSAAESERERD